MSEQDTLYFDGSCLLPAEMGHLARLSRRLILQDIHDLPRQMIFRTRQPSCNHFICARMATG